MPANKKLIFTKDVCHNLLVAFKNQNPEKLAKKNELGILFFLINKGEISDPAQVYWQDFSDFVFGPIEDDDYHNCLYQHCLKPHQLKKHFSYIEDLRKRRDFVEYLQFNCELLFKTNYISINAIHEYEDFTAQLIYSYNQEIDKMRIPEIRKVKDQRQTNLVKKTSSYGKKPHVDIDSLVIPIKCIMDFAAQQTDQGSVRLLQNLMYQYAQGDVDLIKQISDIKPYSEPKFSNIQNLTIGDRVNKKYAN